jgi:hypothetical protein
VFEEGKVKEKLRYPPKLVNAIVQVKAQLVLDGEIKEIGHVGGPDPHEEANFEEHHHGTLPKASELRVSEPVIDAKAGVTLDPKKVAEARASELERVKRQGVYTKISEDTCYAEAGRPPIINVKMDRQKQGRQCPVREVKSKGDAAMLPEYSLFSSMPLLEALKLMCSLLATLRVSRSGGKLTLKLTDISRAHFYGTATRCVDYRSKPCIGLVMRVRRGRKTTRLCYRNMGSEQAKPGHVSSCTKSDQNDGWCTEMTPWYWPMKRVTHL